MNDEMGAAGRLPAVADGVPPRPALVPDRLWDEYYVARHSQDMDARAEAQRAIAQAAATEAVIRSTEDLVVAVNRYLKPGLDVDDWREILAIAAEIGSASR